MNCKCLLINGTGSAIASVTLRHGSGLGMPGSMHDVYTALTLPAGGRSVPQNTDQEAGLHDYWKMSVQITAGGQIYSSTQAFESFFSCDVPKDGSMSATIGPVAASGNYPVEITASRERDCGNDAGSVHGELVPESPMPAVPINI